MGNQKKKKKKKKREKIRTNQEQSTLRIVKILRTISVGSSFTGSAEKMKKINKIRNSLKLTKNKNNM